MAYSPLIVTTLLQKQMPKQKDEPKLVFFIEATMGFEPMMRVLQTLALPLGDVAIKTDC
jgi:hypothetical protein